MGERARLVGHKLLMSISCFASLGVFLVSILDQDCATMLTVVPTVWL
jgi:hypothetical protein